MQRHNAFRSERCIKRLTVSHREMFAKVSHLLYEALPTNGKPSLNEYTVLAAVLSTRCNSSEPDVLSLATGTKCIGVRLRDHDKNGCLVVDSHAEVLARRSFKRYLLKCLRIIFCSPEIAEAKDFPLYLSPDGAITIKNGFKFHLFISDSPCGDGSIYEISNVKHDVNFTGAKLVENIVDPGSSAHTCPREDTQQLGQLRTKSGRSDISQGNRTFSKSCTDKISKWTLLGIQGSLIANFIHDPVQLSSIVIGQDPFTDSQKQQMALDRGLRQRYEHDPSLPKLDKWPVLSVVGSAEDPQREQIIGIPLEGLVRAHIFVSKDPSPPTGVGKKYQEYLFEQQTATFSGAARFVTSELNEGFETSKERRNIQDRGKEKLNACSTSINWIKNVGEMDAVESRKKRISGGICGGSVEVTQAHTGALQGAVKKSVGQPEASSRLCRRELASLFAEVVQLAAISLHKQPQPWLGAEREQSAEQRDVQPSAGEPTSGEPTAGEPTAGEPEIDQGRFPSASFGGAMILGEDMGRESAPAEAELGDGLERNVPSGRSCLGRIGVTARTAPDTAMISKSKDFKRAFELMSPAAPLNSSIGDDNKELNPQPQSQSQSQRQSQSQSLHPECQQQQQQQCMDNFRTILVALGASLAGDSISPRQSSQISEESFESSESSATSVTSVQGAEWGASEVSANSQGRCQSRMVGNSLSGVSGVSPSDKCLQSELTDSAAAAGARASAGAAEPNVLSNSYRWWKSLNRAYSDRKTRFLAIATFRQWNIGIGDGVVVSPDAMRGPGNDGFPLAPVPVPPTPAIARGPPSGTPSRPLLGAPSSQGKKRSEPVEVALNMTSSSSQALQSTPHPRPDVGADYSVAIYNRNYFDAASVSSGKMAAEMLHFPCVQSSVVAGEGHASGDEEQQQQQQQRVCQEEVIGEKVAGDAAVGDPAAKRHKPAF